MSRVCPRKPSRFRPQNCRAIQRGIPYPKLKGLGPKTNNAGIPERERMLVSAYFPVSTKRSPEFHVLNVSWSVGKAVDVLSQR